ncbi:MAG: serine/threonine-protein kinase, partial [Myxococcota bacterium]
MLDLLGHGGIASVYRVRHVELGSLHALKLLELRRGQVRERLLDEGRAQATLVHPNVVRVTDVLIHDDAPVLVMELVDGPSLDRYVLRHKRLELAEARSLAIGITRGLRAAHASGLVHRDLKPGNVLLAPNDRGAAVPVPKLSDFGLVKVLRDDQRRLRTPTRTGIAMGTPEFMAPEQIRDAAGVDARADLYSLGCVLYAMVTGRLPFTGDGLTDLFDRIVAGAFPRPSAVAPGVPPTLDALIVRLLRADPAERPQSCDEVLATLTDPRSGVPSGPSTIHPGALLATAVTAGPAWP